MELWLRGHGQEGRGWCPRVQPWSCSLPAACLSSAGWSRGKRDHQGPHHCTAPGVSLFPGRGQSQGPCTGCSQHLSFKNPLLPGFVGTMSRALALCTQVSTTEKPFWGSAARAAGEDALCAVGMFLHAVSQAFPNSPAQHRLPALSPQKTGAVRCWSSC